MIPVLLIVVPLLCGAISFFLKSERAVKTWALVSSLVTLVVSLLSFSFLNSRNHLFAEGEWMPLLGSSFSVGIDGMGKMLCLLTAIAFPVIYISTWRQSYSKAHNFFALMLLSQAGLMGVFVAFDALLFYFFWELALIPA